MLAYLIELPYEILGHNILGFLELIDIIQWENAAASHKSQQHLKTILTYCPPIFFNPLFKFKDSSICYWFSKRRCRAQVMKFDVGMLLKISIDIEHSFVDSIELYLCTNTSLQFVEPLQNSLINQRVTYLNVKANQDPAVMDVLFSLLSDSSVHSLDIDTSNLSKWMEHIKKIGPCLRKLSVANRNIESSTIITITEYCPYLEKLLVGCVSQISESNILQNIAQNCSYVCSVDIKLKYNTSAEADADLTAFAEKCPQLEELCLTCRQLTDQSVIALAQHCSRLKKLKIQECKLTSNSLIALSERGLPLEELDIPWIPIPSAEIAAQCAHALSRIRDFDTYNYEDDLDQFCDVIQYMTRLRGLYLGNSKDHLLVPQLQLHGHCAGLESLIIGWNSSFYPPMQLSALVTICPQLQTLEIYQDTYISDEVFIGMARSCPHLQKVELTKCDVAEESVLALAVHCRLLREIFINRCRASVEAMERVVMYCRHLTDLHIHVYTNSRYFWNHYNSKEIRAIREKGIERDRVKNCAQPITQRSGPEVITQCSSGAEVITQCSSGICLIL